MAVEYKAGDIVVVCNNDSRLTHHLSTPQVVKIHSVDSDGDLIVEGFCADRGYIDTQCIKPSNVRPVKEEDGQFLYTLYGIPGVS